MAFSTKTPMMFAAAAILFLGSSARAARLPRIELLRVVTISGTRIFLSDLLPAGAPERLRSQAAEISLGSAPQPGSVRLLARDTVRSEARENPKLLSAISVPETVSVSRGMRPISVTEVFDALRAALKHQASPAADSLRPENIFLQSEVFVDSGDPGLQVLRMDFDRLLGRARFLLWPSRDPKVLPFVVIAWIGQQPQEVHSSRLAELRSREVTSGGEVALSVPSTQSAVHTGQLEGKHREILVAQGKRATLALYSDAVRIYVDVISLDRGALGEKIRVRLADGDKIVNAWVDGKDHLQAKF